jgi:hypothetical protein
MDRDILDSSYTETLSNISNHLAERSQNHNNNDSVLGGGSSENPQESRGVLSNLPRL